MEENRTITSESKEVSPIKMATSQIIPVMIKNIVLIAFGMTVGYPTILIPALSECATENEICLNENEISWIGSLHMLSVPMGCMISGVVSQAIGRKITMQVGSVLMILCWATFRFSNGTWQIYAALMVIGFTGGLIESPVLTYVSEICEPRLRGSLLSLGSSSSTLGILLEFYLGSILHWRSVTIYSAIAPLAALVCLFFVPESPYWLITKNKLAQARLNLAWARGWTTVDKIEPEFQELLEGTEKFLECKRNAFTIKNYAAPQFLQPFFLICYLHVVYNFSGIQTILVYAVNICEVMKVPMNEYDATVFLGLAQFMGCLVCVFVVPYTGKRLLAFTSMVFGASSIIIVATYAFLNDINDLNVEKQSEVTDLQKYSWVPLVFVLLYAFSVTLGLRSLIWTLVAECFPIETRAVGTGFLGAMYYVFGFASSKIFFDLIASITLPGVLWFYGIVGLIGLVALYFWLPETEGRSLKEITDHFSGKHKLSRTLKSRSKVVLS